MSTVDEVSTTGTARDERSPSTLRLVLITLAILTIASGVGFNLIHRLPWSDEEIDQLAGVYLPVVAMSTPLVSLLIVKYGFRRPIKIWPGWPRRGRILRNLALVASIVLSWLALLLVFSALLSRVSERVFGEFVFGDQALRARIALLSGNAGSGQDLPPLVVVIAVQLVQAILLGFTLNAVFAFLEEALWRGYLPTALKGGFYARYLTIGVIWGLWHAPINVQGYNYGPEHALAGAALFVPFCAVFSLLFGIVVERTHNVLYAACMHGLFNALPGAVLIFVVSDNLLINGPIGVVSIAAMAVVFVLFRRFRFAPEPAPA